MHHQDKNALCAIIAGYFQVSFVPVQQVINNLLDKAGIPADWQVDRANMSTGNAEIDARNLVKWALSKGANPDAPSCKTLGCILETLLPDLGVEDRSTVYSIIVSYDYLDENRRRLLSEKHNLRISDTPTKGVFNAKTADYDLFKKHKFDMTILVQHCLDVVVLKQGIIGLALPCDLPDLVESLCTRLAEELGQNNTMIRKPSPLKPLVSAVGQVLAEIRAYVQRGLLDHGDVICPVQVHVYGDASILEHFWNDLCSESTTEIQHRLIIILVGSSDTQFPVAVTKLATPHFEVGDVFLWVRNVVNVLKWPEHVITVWTQNIMDLGSGSSISRLSSIYEHLEFVSELLKQGHTADSFLEKLKQRSQQYG